MVTVLIIIIGVFLALFVVSRTVGARRKWPRLSPDGHSDAFHMKVAGVTHETLDGQSRQAILARCKAGQPVVLVRDMDNPYSRDAIRVELDTGEDIGWIPEEIARGKNGLAAKLDAGKRIEAWIFDVTGGTKGKPSRGCNLVVGVYR